jgi:hypothetical protein
MGLKLFRPPVTFSPPVSLSELAVGREFKSYKFFFPKAVNFFSSWIDWLSKPGWASSFFKELILSEYLHSTAERSHICTCTTS